MGDIAPKMAQLSDDILYADIWARPQLSKFRIAPPHPTLCIMTLW